MAHTPHKSLQDLIDDIKLEDNAVYLEFITKVNNDNLDSYNVQTILKDDNLNSKLTDNQLELLKVSYFKSGYRLHFYHQYNQPKIYFITRWDNIKVDNSVAYTPNLNISKEDLKFIPRYHQSKWKQANPTNVRKHTKGLQFEFNMDEFSLNIFRNSIKKPFLRTEAKNLILKVNKAYNKTDYTDNIISIRNRFYALILDNTPVHTKAMLNELYHTPLEDNNTITSTNTYYNPHKDEAIAIYRDRFLQSISTPDSIDEYSTDTVICTHMKLDNIQSNRLLNRYYSAASVMSTLAIKTSNKTYEALADRMISNLTPEQLEPFHELTQSVGMLNTLIETNINNKEK